MKYFLYTFIITSIAFGGHKLFGASTTVPLLFSEIQLGTSDSAREEFIELVNTSAQLVQIDGVELEYRSKNGTTWSNKATLSGSILPYGRFLISNYLDAHSQVFSGGLASSGGHLRLLHADTVIDEVSWGAFDDQTNSQTPPLSGQSLKRSVNEDGYFVDSDMHRSDWFVSSTPTPWFDAAPAMVESSPPSEGEQPNENSAESEIDVSIEVEREPSSSESPQEAVAQDTLSYARIELSEVMPDPVAPLTDAEHEYVELYNPNGFAVELEGYRVESGADWRYGYSLKSYRLQPGEYLALYSASTGLTLSNSGSSVRLLDPNEKLLDSTTYPKAQAGYSWSRVSGEWQWLNPTNNTDNGVVAGETEAPTAQTAPEAASEQRSDVAFGAPANTDEGSGAESSDANSTEPTAENTLNTWVLAGVGGIAVLYGLYEYRSDIRIRIQQLRRYLAVRRQNRT